LGLRALASRAGSAGCATSHKPSRKRPDHRSSDPRFILLDIQIRIIYRNGSNSRPGLVHSKGWWSLAGGASCRGGMILTPELIKFNRFIKLILIEHKPLLACFGFVTSQKWLVSGKISFRKRLNLIDVGAGNAKQGQGESGETGERRGLPRRGD